MKISGRFQPQYTALLYAFIAVRGKAPTVRKATDSNNFKSTTSLAQEHYLFGSRALPLWLKSTTSLAQEHYLFGSKGIPL